MARAGYRSRRSRGDVSLGRDRIPLRTGQRQGIADPTNVRPYPWPMPQDFIDEHPGAAPTEPEWAIFWAHGQLGLVEGLDFSYRNTIFNHTTADAQIDFTEFDPPLAIEVQGEFSHYKLGSAKQAEDIDRLTRLTALGLDVIFIDDRDAQRDPVFYLREALNGIDHSIAAGH